MRVNEETPLVGEKHRKFNFWTESKDILELALPISVGRISWTGMKTTDTAILGHVGTEFLAASSISDLYTSSSGVFLSGRIVGVLCSQAIGAENPELAGIWLQVALFVLFCVSIPVILIWICTEWALLWFGFTPVLAANAGYYALVLMCCLPARILYNETIEFLQAGKHTQPSMWTGLLSLFWNLLFGLVFVLGIPIPGFDGFGFTACPIVTTCTEWASMIFMFTIFIKIKKLHEGQWPEDGLSFKHITCERVKIFLSLYVPAALSIASDFWRFAVIGGFAAALGENEVSVFTSSYRILWMCLIVVGSIAQAIGIKIGQALGAGDIHHAKFIFNTGFVLNVVLLFCLSLIVYVFPRALGSIFSNDPAILDQFSFIAFPFATCAFFMNLSVFLERIPLVMGRTQAIFFVGLIGSWIGQVPAVFVFVEYWQHDLQGLYYGMTIGYALVTVLLLGVIANSDWEYYAQEARKRSEKNVKKE